MTVQNCNFLTIFEESQEDKGIHVMRKSELQRKKVKFLCVAGLELRALPQKKQQVFKDRSTLRAKYSTKEMVQIFHSQDVQDVF